MRLPMLALGVAFATLSPMAALAQDVGANATYGTTTLRAGFTPDPQRITVTSGGVIDASRISSRCAGFIANAPDVRLHYDAGSLPLIISAASSADTTLVINAPDGNWYCDDDGGNQGLNPSIRFNSPMSGRYEIWIGSYANGEYANATVHISELTSQ